MFGLTILGNNSAIPAFDRHPTAQALMHDDQVFLIDCGEGTQMQLARYKIRRSKINHIFISHLHGDHYFGLIGVITSMGLLGREEALFIYGPGLLKEIILLQLRAADTLLKFPLHFIIIKEATVLLRTGKMEVSCFPVKHRVECWGYLFREQKPPRKLNREKAIENGIPAVFFNRLQMGEHYETKSGNIIANDMVTYTNDPGRSYAFCADTLFDPGLGEWISGVNLLYHEATYLSDLEQRAAERYHSTAKQAAMMAGYANANQLIIGHFSSKYQDLTAFETEAQSIFPKTQLALEGTTFRILHSTKSSY